MRILASLAAVFGVLLGAAGHARAQVAPASGSHQFTAGVELGVGRAWPLVPSGSAPTKGAMDVHVGGLLGFVAAGLETQVAVGFREREVGFQTFSPSLQFVTGGVRVRVPVRRLERGPRTIFVVAGLDLEHRLGGPNPDDKGRAATAERAEYRSLSAHVLLGGGLRFDRLSVEGRAGWVPTRLFRVRSDLPWFRVFSVGLALTVDLGRW
jgi:hypothetical protein